MQDEPSDDVDGGVNHDPHDVDEMPVDAGYLDPSSGRPETLEQQLAGLPGHPLREREISGEVAQSDRTTKTTTTSTSARPAT